MRGDFTRFSHQPGKHYAGVLMQQGRVQLDADWNEQFDIDDERWRAQTVDTIGACGRPDADRGFELDLASGSDLGFKAGHIYVDGLFYDLADDITYGNQPDLPDPPPLEPQAGRTDLFYLDVWRRHVTAVEDPEILETALGGPDTASRVRTVAQVRVERGVDSVRCDPQPAFDALVRLSPGRMSATAEDVEPKAADNPCQVAPGAGFRGVENRLYRVEIHNGDEPGPATFVWSRDNGSVLAAVTAFKDGPENQIEVSSLGRDDTLRFCVGDWVEVLSDRTELAGEPGTIAEITDVDEASRILSLSAPVSDPGDGYFPRVRRWDQKRAPIPVSEATTEWFELEDGIKIMFTKPGFRTGDFWVIPAREAPGEIEEFTDAPPRGIEHHYCRLAVVTWQEDNDEELSFTAEECVPWFPPLTERSQAGCCTVTVGAGSAGRGDYDDLQKAVDSLTGPGRVCLLPGEHKLTETVVIGQAGVVVAGCGGEARVVAPAGKPALRVSQADAVGLEELRVEADDAPAVQADGCTRLRVLGCRLTSTGGGEALVVSGGEDVEVLDCRLDGLPALSVQARRVRLAGNRCATGGIWLRDGSADARIEDNEVGDGRGPGIALGGLAPAQPPSAKGAGVARVAVLGNRVQGMEGSGVATVAATEEAPLADVRDLTVAANQIRSCARRPADPRYDAEAVGGVTLRGVTDVRIHDNLIEGNGGGEDGVRACGIFVHSSQGLQIRGNAVRGNGAREAGDNPKVYQGGIVAMVALGTEPAGPAAVIHGNTVTSPSGQALLVTALGPVLVADNTLATLEPAAQPFPFSRLGGGVFLLDLGRTPILSDAAIGFGLGVGTSLAQCRLDPDDTLGSPPPEAATPVPGGEVLVHGNQISLRVAEADVKPPSAAVAVLSTDDAALLDNQVRTQVDDGMIWAGVLAFAPTLRASSNRFTETPCRAVFSYYSTGLANVATSNQANHCLGVLGSQTVDDDNHVLLAGDCQRVTAALTSGSQ
jgi:hypothetical protein